LAKLVPKYYKFKMGFEAGFEELALQNIEVI
jgi:hypothetical protein